MFMFWSKRTVLTRRLLKAKVRGEHETECEAQEDNDNGNSSSLSNSPQRAARSPSSRLRRHRDNAEDPARLLRCKELLKTLKENQLEMLLTVVESCGADLSSCILVPRRRLAAAAAAAAATTVADPQEGEEHLLLRRDLQAQQLHQRRRRQSTATAAAVTTAAAASCGSSSPGAAALHEQLLAERQAARQYHRQRQQRGRSSSTATEDEEENDERRARDRCWGHASTATAEDAPPQLDPHLLCCQIWRWPDLAYSSELKRLPVCHSAKDPVYICCNPYHWSRLCKPESPPPPYCLIADRLRPEDRAPREGDSRRCRNIGPLPVPGSLTTNEEGELGQKEWCTLAYWELGGRVGRLYPVEPATVNVFDSLHDGDGLCLATLAENHSSSTAVQRTRSKIGLGLMLSQETDGVWAYNRSDSPIFVNSPTLDDPESRTLLVYRVPPGFCLNIFDRAKTLQQLPYANPVASATTGFASGPVDVNSVRISFAKGWGPKYSRQEITSCPCWLEVLLAPCR